MPDFAANFVSLLAPCFWRGRSCFWRTRADRDKKLAKPAFVFARTYAHIAQRISSKRMHAHTNEKRIFECTPTTLKNTLSILHSKLTSVSA